MRLIPRYYQQEAFDAARKHMIESPEPGILELATGAGKSIIIAMLADWLAQKGRRVLMLTDSSDLVSQNHAKYLATGNDAGIFSAKLGKKHSKHQVIFASVQSIARSLARFADGFSLIVIDECFRGDTLIATEHGNITIADLAAMPNYPKVKCMDESAGAVMLDTPVRCFQNGTKRVSYLRHSEGVIVCTPTHRFYSAGSWVRASQLKPGQRLMLMDSSSGFLTRLRRALAAVAKELYRSAWIRQ